MSRSDGNDITTRQLISVFDRHIRLYEKLNQTKRAENLKDDRQLSRHKETLKHFSKWLESQKAR